MRRVPLALVVAALVGAAGFVAAGPGRRSNASPAVLSVPAPPELALLWPGPAAAGPDSTWPGGFRVVHRGGGASGPVVLTVRTPLGIAYDSQILAHLDPGELAAAELALPLAAGMTALCLEVRSTSADPALGEVDLTDNRICRRPGEAERFPHSIRATSQETHR